ncbi:hypothetical protein ACO0K9_19815 [Undibacterium sp. Ji50W]
MGLKPRLALLCVAHLDHQTALLASIIGAFALNLAISLNHRPDRYVAM